MHIKIAERIRPYSHLPGTCCILPGTSYRLQIYPAYLRIEDLSGMSPVFLASLTFAINGPLNEFTIELDLERGNIRVWGKTLNGFFRYRIAALHSCEGVAITFEKIPENQIKCSSEGVWEFNPLSPVVSGDVRFFLPERYNIDSCSLYQLACLERLSLGNHKSLDWELVRRRRNFAEIFPIWHRLGQVVSVSGEDCPSGVLSLFKECREVISAHKPEEIIHCFERIYLTGFEGLLSPRLNDGDFQGITIPSVEAQASSSALQVLTIGAALIRSLFVQFTANTILTLPAIPPEFHCGRMIDILCPDKGRLSMEWTKKELRCLTFLPDQSQELAFRFTQGLKRCRLRKDYKDRGKVYRNGEAIEFVKGQNYWFDNFEK